MRQYSLLFISGLIFAMQSTAFAFINHFNQTNLELIYCPQKIICSSENPNNCQPSDDISKYWNSKVSSAGTIPINPGEYYFNGATYAYGTRNTCTYENRKLYLEITFYIDSAAGTTNVANVNKTTQWVGNDYPYYANCSSKSVTDCPFVEGPFFGYQFAVPKVRLMVSAFANGNMIFGMTPLDKEFVNVTYDGAINACGSVKQCKIDFSGWSDDGEVNLGSAIIDLTNNLKIIELHSNESSGVMIKTKWRF